MFDPEAYRPKRIGGEWNTEGPDPITGRRVTKPDARIIEHSNSLGDELENTAHCRKMLECKFWQNECEESEAIVIFRSGHWEPVTFAEWQRDVLGQLWGFGEAADEHRTDYGPKRWKVIQPSTTIPANIAVRKPLDFDLLLAGGVSLDLPNRQWLYLQEAVAFAQCGFCWRRDRSPGSAFADFSATYPWLSSDMLVSGFIPGDSVDDVTANFDRALSEAAFAGLVRMQGKSTHEQRARHADIPLSYFNKTRRFNYLTSYISERGGQMSQAWHGSGDDGEWAEVLIEREGFQAWLFETFPPRARISRMLASGIITREQAEIEAKRFGLDLEPTGTARWIPFVPDDRDNLISDVREGRLTPEQAEAKANELGIGPLERLPDPAQFDPMEEPFWTLPMAVAWIAWRDVHAVRLSWDKYRKECLFWAPKTYWVPGNEPATGFALNHHGPANLDFLNATVRLGEPQIPAEAAFNELKRAAQEGRIAVTAIAEGQGRQEIAAHIWIELEWQERERDGSGYLVINKIRYKEPRINHTSLIKLFAKSKIISKNKGGRTPYDWNSIEILVIHLMDHHDDFSHDDPEWNSQAKLEAKIQEHFFETIGKQVSESVIRTRIKPMLERWRSTRSKS